ncbi:MAG: acyl--CoA ligase [Acidobacteriota bacterium]|nr:acyl--CoA ligase [Acidobacteriota bacterium]
MNSAAIAKDMGTPASHWRVSENAGILPETPAKPVKSEDFAIASDDVTSIAGIFFRAITLYPKRPALVAGGRTWSYEELGRAVLAAASGIRELVPAGGGRIAIVGGNHPAYILAYWGAQCAGCSTVEADGNESLQTLLGVLGATRPRFLVTDRSDLILAVQGNIPVCSFEKFCGKSDNAPEMPVLPEAPIKDSSIEASIVYTSGTTSSAKGVVLSQGNFCFIARAVADYMGLNETDRCALILPLCHTYGKSVLLGAAAAGAAIVILDGFGNQRRFLSRLTTEGCTVLCAVPYHLNTLVKSGCLPRLKFSPLRIIASSADKLPPAVIDSLTEALPEVRIFSMYGLTEAATRVCYVPPEMIHAKKESCGRPLPRVELKIVTEDGRAAAAYETGEIILRGPNVMTGYLGDPDLTAETIVDGWLKTGDIGHLDADGFLYIDGRKKDLIKCAGERISPSEIEEILMEYPEVEGAAAVGRPDSLMGEVIHAYVASRNPLLKKADLREHCRARLPHNKVPYGYTIVERLPVTGTGKIKKFSLGKR